MTRFSMGIWFFRVIRQYKSRERVQLKAQFPWNSYVKIVCCFKQIASVSRRICLTVRIIAEQEETRTPFCSWLVNNIARLVLERGVTQSVFWWGRAVLRDCETKYLLQRNLALHVYWQYDIFLIRTSWIFCHNRTEKSQSDFLGKAVQGTLPTWATTP